MEWNPGGYYNSWPYKQNDSAPLEIKKGNYCQM